MAWIFWKSSTGLPWHFLIVCKRNFGPFGCEHVTTSQRSQRGRFVEPSLTVILEFKDAISLDNEPKLNAWYCHSVHLPLQSWQAICNSAYDIKSHQGQSMFIALQGNIRKRLHTKFRITGHTYLCLPLQSHLYVIGQSLLINHGQRRMGPKVRFGLLGRRYS